MFQIITDSTTDLPLSYFDEYNVKKVNLKCILEGVTYGKELELDNNEFYRLMRNEGKLPTTSQVNPDEAYEAIKESIEEGSKEILVLAFSSGLSGTYNSFRLAAEEIREEYPDIDVVVIDSLCASMGEGLFVHKAVLLRDAGKGMHDTADWLEEHKLNFVHSFTVDDLNHLWRGGRVSKTAAVIGTIAGIKPILIVDNEGHLIPMKKVRGRKKSLIALVDDMEDKMGSYIDKNDVVFISHGDCEEDAIFVKNEIEKRWGEKEFKINMIGPVVGSHAGPGTVALFYMGDVR